jgi:DNA helicase-2/ATP-dependent DNA helicase PcrA
MKNIHGKCLLNFTLPQSAVIEAPLDTNLKVVAVPGSGKSTVLIYRIEQFLIADYASKDLLVVMFNDDAVVNFEHDLKNIDFMDVPQVKTYHSLGSLICCMLEKANFLNIGTLIVSDSDYRDFYRNVVLNFTPLNLTETVKPERRSTVNKFIRFVELTKTSMSTPEEVFNKFLFDDKHKVFIDLFHHSEIERINQGKRFFTDLIRDPLLTCQQSIKAYQYITNRYKVIMVDEYQDASSICHALIMLVAGTKAKINVVGDGDQAIYSFTGASPEFLLSKVDQDFPDVRLFNLPETFRYGHSVCLLANNCISNNTNRDDILCVSAITKPTKVTIANYTSEIVDCEHSDIIEEIIKWKARPKKNYKDIAILVRSYAPISGLEFALIKNNIPYKLGSGSNYTLHNEDIRWIESILFIFSPRSDDTTISNALYIYLCSYTYKIAPFMLGPILKLLVNEAFTESLEAIKHLYKTLPRSDYISLRARIVALSKVDERGYSTSKELIDIICEHASIISSVQRKDFTSNKTILRRFIAVRHFISSLDIEVTQTLEEIKNHRNLLSATVEDCIEITTLHKSKGLAWPFVIVGFLEENILPNLYLEKDVEVERRLYFVGITRAKEQLTLHIPIDDEKLITNAESYQGFMPEVDYAIPFKASRFLYESNIVASIKVATAIHTNTSAELGKTGNLDLFNRYLSNIKVNFRLSGL